MQTKIKISLVCFFVLGAFSQLFATDGIVSVSSDVSDKDALVVAKSQVVLKPGFRATALKSNFYAKIDDYNIVSNGVAVSAGNNIITHSAENNLIPTPSTVEKIFYPVSTINNVQNITQSNSISLLEYKDGLNRGCMTVLKNATVQGNDIVQVNSYNSTFEEKNAWLPIPMGGIVTNSPQIAADQSICYFNDENAYTTVEQDLFTTSYCLPGKYHHSQSKVNKVELMSSSNLSLVEFDVNDDGSLIITNDDYTLAYYEKKCEHYVDEDGKERFVFKNEYDNVIMIRKVVNTEIYADTYYVYDNFNRLRYILPPECVNRLTENQTYTLGTKESYKTDPLALYAFIYNYDEDGKCVQQKMPGKEWESFIYDNKNRLIFSQDGNLHEQNKWIYYKYDNFNRLTVQGIASLNFTKDQIVDLYNNNNAAETTFLNSSCKCNFSYF